MITCVCYNLSEEEILSSSCRTYEELNQQTGAGSRCGCCEDEIKQLFSNIYQNERFTIEEAHKLFVTKGN